MFGAIPASMLFDMARSQGIYTQLELDLECPPYYVLNPEFMVSVPETISYYNSSGEKYGTHTSVDHPSFTKLREHLGTKGYIEIQRSWCNGDRVLKPFYLNNYILLPGDQFSCGAAMSGRKQLTKNYNDGKIDSSAKNYRDENDYF